MFKQTFFNKQPGLPTIPIWSVQSRFSTFCLDGILACVGTIQCPDFLNLLQNLLQVSPKLQFLAHKFKKSSAVASLSIVNRNFITILTALTQYDNITCPASGPLTTQAQWDDVRVSSLHHTFVNNKFIPYRKYSRMPLFITMPFHSIVFPVGGALYTIRNTA